MSKTNMHATANQPNWASEDGKIVLYLADCLDVLPTLSVDVTITDPPYDEYTHGRHLATVVKDRAELSFGCISKEDFVRFTDIAVKTAKRWVVLTCDYRHAPLVYDREYFIRQGVWVKPNGAPQFTGDRPGMGYEPVLILHRPGRKYWNGGGAHAVWKIPAEQGVHPTMKPMALVCSFVSLFSDVGETICDPFMGSGTTAIACIRSGRSFIGIEKDPAHFKTACERIRRELEQPMLIPVAAQKHEEVALL